MFQTKMLLSSLRWFSFGFLLLLLAFQVKVLAQEQQGCFAVFSSGEVVDLNRLCGDGDQIVPDASGSVSNSDASEAALNRDRLLDELENSEELLAMREGYEQGMLLTDQGNYQQAISELTRTINSYPDYAEAYLARGLAYSLQGNEQEYISNFEQAILAYQGRGEFHKAEYYQSLVDALRTQ
jgi:tetratricopeptide (TPR) repeat protein